LVILLTIKLKISKLLMQLVMAPIMSSSIKPPYKPLLRKEPKVKLIIMLYPLKAKVMIP